MTRQSRLKGILEYMMAAVMVANKPFGLFMSETALVVYNSLDLKEGLRIGDKRNQNDLKPINAFLS